MRLVSQHGSVDIPYEQARIEHRQEEVVAIVGDREYTMGKYTSMKKSYKAMEMLREEYDYVRTFETICNGSSNYPNLPSYIFQFPKDEDVEV